MEYGLYCIYDAATNIYGIPMAQTNDAEAIRSFAHESMKKESIWNSHPSDFVMYKIGVYNSSDGMITTYGAPDRICCATDFVR